MSGDTSRPFGRQSSRRNGGYALTLGRQQATRRSDDQALIAGVPVVAVALAIAALIALGVWLWAASQPAN